MEVNIDGGSKPDRPPRKNAQISGLLAELLQPAKDWGTRAADWSITEAKAYLAWLRVWFVRTGIVLAVTIVIAGVGIALGYDSVVPFALVVAALSLGLLTLISFPILVIASTFSQLRPVGMAFRGALWVFTWLFGLALLFLVVPMSPAGVLVVMIASLFLSSLYLATGQVPSIGAVRTRAISVVIVTVVFAFVTNALPQVSSTASRAVGAIDATMNRWLSGAVLTPKAVNIQTSTECWNTAFFGADGEPLYWVENDERGQHKLFSSGGRSPLTGAPLVPATRSLRDAYCKGLEAREQQAALDRDASRATSRGGATQPAQSAGSKAQKKAVIPTAGEREFRIAREIAAVEALILAAPDPWNELRPEWATELNGKTAIVRFSTNARGLAATTAKRLQMAGMVVIVEPLMEEVSLRRPTIDYSQTDIHSASALNAVLAEISQFDMDSHVASMPLSVTLP